MLEGLILKTDQPGTIARFARTRPVLFLAHHGDAVGPDVNPMRPLSDRGRVEVDMLAQMAAARGAKPDVISHSGKLRAKQTAEANGSSAIRLHRFPQSVAPAPDPTNWILDAITAETETSCSPDIFRICPPVWTISVGNGGCGSRWLPVEWDRGAGGRGRQVADRGG